MADHSVVEAAKELNVGRSWLYQQAQAHTVPCQRYGRTLRFTDQQIAAIRAQFEQPAISTRRLRGLGRAS